MTSQHIRQKYLYVHSNRLFYVENVVAYNILLVDFYFLLHAVSWISFIMSLESVGSVTDILLCYGS